MPLHCVAIHDDDVDAAGNDIAAADFIDGEDKVIMREIGGQMVAPVLRAAHYGVYDAFAAAGSLGARWKIQPNPWPETKTIGNAADWFSGSETADAGVAACAGGTRELRINQYAIQLTNNLNWVNAGNSVLYSSVTDQDVMLLLQMSYGAPSLSRGGHLIHIYKTFAAVATADVWDAAFSEVLSDDSPGIDPDRRYRVYSMRCLGGTTLATDYAMAARITPKGSTVSLGCLGGGNVLDAPWTVYDADSIEFNGNAVIDADTVGSSTNDGGVIEMFLEDIGPAVTGGSQGGLGGRITGGGPIGGGGPGAGGGLTRGKGIFGVKF